MSEFTYKDGRYYRDGKPYFVIASDYQYYRDRRENWEDRLTKLRDGGVEVITFYTPWRHHLQYEGGKYWFDFEGKTKDSRDVIHFMQLIERLGLYMIVKPGPFVHSELNVGGLPDLVSPTFNPGMPAARRHHGRACRWGYDNSQLPSPMDTYFDGLVEEWLAAVGEIIKPYGRPGGAMIGLQLNDETIYCMSNDPPWHIGYEPAGMRYYQSLLQDRYGDIATYNKLHGTNYEAFDYVAAPKLVVADQAPASAPAGARSREDALGYVDWAEFQWRLRRDLYERYERYLGIDHLPYLTNYAGITPPIQENVPDAQEEASEIIPEDFLKVYSEWWFAMNRVDQDLDVHEYGMISWLGVAAYDPVVFDRYVNTARRRRGINMEENWGFAKLYDHRSKYPMIPFFQTLASLAAGATGYDIFVGVSTDYWDETLDKTTKKQCPTFPSDAPIDEHGNLRPMYYTAKMLNNWFAHHGEALLGCEQETDCAYLLYSPYAGVSSWVPDERYWGVKGYQIPRCGHQGFEEFSTSLQNAGYSFAMFELESATPEQMKENRSLAIQSAFFMDADSQRRLADFISGGGRLFISGDLPEVDLKWEPCTILKDAVQAAAGKGKVVYDSGNFFADGNFAQVLSDSGIESNVTYSPGMRAYVHRSKADTFVFFFSFDLDGSHEKVIEFFGQKLELTLGSKTCGVVRITGQELTGYMVKAVNEVENITSDVVIRFGDKVIKKSGDFSSLE